MNFLLTKNYSTTGYLGSRDQTQLFYRHYEVANHRAIVLLVHGFGEHSGRYSHVIDRLLEEGFEVWCLDLRGHGHSQGSRGDVEKFTQYEDDVDALIQLAKSKNRKSKIFIVAHSMGALVSLALLAHTKQLVDGLVLSCPLLGLKITIPVWKKYLTSVLLKIVPKVKFRSTIRGKQLSSDDTFSEAYDSDPLVLKSLSIRAFWHMVEAYKNAAAFASQVQAPFLMQVAGRDTVVDTNAAKSWFKLVNSPTRDATLKNYPDFLHEIYNEKERELAMSDMVIWLKQRS